MLNEIYYRGTQMDIGEKIKKLRTAKLMTQAELAGGEITRNMLSRIENGAAMPSLSTVMHIASKLNVSVGFLLGDEEDELIYFKSREIDGIKKAYANKNYELCREMCRNSEWEDDELRLVFAECSMRVGIEHFRKGELRTATELFDEAIEHCSGTVYDTSAILSEIRSYLEYMEILSPSLSAYIADSASSERVFLKGDGFCVYSSVCVDSQYDALSELPYLAHRIELIDPNSAYRMHIEARLCMERGEHKEAHDILHRLLFDDSCELPEPVMYFVFCDLEICCKEIGDFKGAYEYSGSKIALLQKLLS